MTNTFQDPYLDGNDQLEQAIHLYYMNQTDENIDRIFEVLYAQRANDKHLIFPADIITMENGETTFDFKTMDVGDSAALVAFTSQAELKKGPQVGAVSYFIDSMLDELLQIPHLSGLLLNPWGESFFCSKDDILYRLIPFYG